MSLDMKTRETARWRVVLRSLIEDLQERFVSDTEFIERVWEAWTEWMCQYTYMVSEDQIWHIEECWKIRPNLNSTAAEFEWLARQANSRAGRFWRSATLRKAIALFREQRRRTDWSDARDLNIVAHYLR